MQVREEDIQVLVPLLSEERLSALIALTGNFRDAIELHQETLSLGASLMNVTATIEITLRNSVCINLEQHFGVSNWLHQPPVPFQWKYREQKNIKDAVDNARRAKYKKLTQAEKAGLDVQAYPNGRPDSMSHIRRVKERRKFIQVSDGSVIAELNFSFWKRLYSPDYDQTLWRTTLKRTFPNKRLNRSDIADQLEIIYQSRNRLAHHEPVLNNRYRDTISAIKFIVQNIGMKNENLDSPLVQLVRNDMDEVVDKADKLHAKLSAFKV